MTNRSSPDIEAELKAVRQQIIDFVDSGAQDSEPIEVTNGDLCRWFDRLEIVSAHLRNAGLAQSPRTEITKEMALAGRKALAVVADRMEEAKLLATSSIDFWQRVGHEPANEIYAAMVAASPVPSTDRRPENCATADSICHFPTCVCVGVEGNLVSSPDPSNQREGK